MNRLLFVALLASVAAQSLDQPYQFKSTVTQQGTTVGFSGCESGGNYYFVWTQTCGQDTTVLGISGAGVLYANNPSGALVQGTAFILTQYAAEYKELTFNATYTNSSETTGSWHVWTCEGEVCSSTTYSHSDDSRYQDAVQATPGIWCPIPGTNEVANLYVGSIEDDETYTDVPVDYWRYNNVQQGGGCWAWFRQDVNVTEAGFYGQLTFGKAFHGAAGWIGTWTDDTLTPGSDYQAGGQIYFLLSNGKTLNSYTEIYSANGCDGIGAATLDDSSPLDNVDTCGSDGKFSIFDAASYCHTRHLTEPVTDIAQCIGSYAPETTGTVATTSGTSAVYVITTFILTLIAAMFA